MNYNSVYHGKLATALGAAASGGAGVVFNATLHGQPTRPSRQKHLEPTCHTFEWAWLMGLWALYKSDSSSSSQFVVVSEILYIFRKIFFPTF